MAKLYKNLIYSTAEYTRCYSAFRGVELNASASITNPARLAYAENLYKDYEADGADVLESIPGYRRLVNCGKSIHAIYYQRTGSGKDHVIIHAADSLMRYPISGVEKGDGVLSSPIATSVGERGFGFTFGKFFYFIDGARILRIDDDGDCMEVKDDSAAPYIPTTYVSGKRYMERNLLTDRFSEEYYLADPSAYSYSSEGLKYSITDADMRYCTVSGISEDATGALSIPAYVTISGSEYKVTRIGNYAFAYNKAITSVNIANGIRSIGINAFYKCTNITTVVFPESVTHIENGAFVDCVSLSRVYFGDGIVDIGAVTFGGCNAFKTVYYSLDTDSFKAIKNVGSLDGKTVIYDTRYEQVTLSLPLHEETDSVDGVSVNGASYAFELRELKDGSKAVLLSFKSLSDATGAKIKISARMKSEKYRFDASSDDSDGLSGYEAICGCRIAEIFDGRIFFAGNPDLPNTVFYTEASADSEDGSLYVGRYNYFNDGVGSYNVIGMLSVRDMLAVFKEGDDGSGSIFYHKKENTESDGASRIYPTAYVHSGICAKGPSASFLDDPVFITREGLYSLEQENINYQRSVVCKSHNVNFKLLKEDLTQASLCTWQGYLVIGINGTVYLADSRATFTHPTGAREYEWFLLKGIGTYQFDERVYIYSHDDSPIAIANVKKAGEKAYSKGVYSEEVDGALYYYVEENGVKHSVLPTNERQGGVYSPATSFISHDKYLFFSTPSGDVCVFNNDKRGVAPDRLISSSGFNAEEYAGAMGDRIHPDFYGFTDHAPIYALKTALDDCGIPHLTKSTVKGSLVIKSRAHLHESILCSTVTDNGSSSFSESFPSVNEGFDDFSFDTPIWNGARYTSTALAERDKKWIEKQIVLSSSKYLSPISIYSIAYRYNVKGKIKNN